jgi:hypothetical protein
MRSLLISLLFVALHVSATFAQGDSYALRGPFEHDGLAIYLIESPQTSTHRYLTLERALETGLAVIHENNSQTLWIENRSDSDLFIQSGDIIKGGQQDRMISSDMIVAAHDTNRNLRVYCVEHDRSTKRGTEPIETFSASHELAPISHLRIIAQSDLTMKVLTPHVGGLTAPDPEQARLFSSLQTLPEFNRPDDPAQEAIWHDVGLVQTGLTRSLKDTVTKNESPSSLQLTLESHALGKKQQHTMSELAQALLDDPKATGVVRVLFGEIVAIDNYASHDLFVAMWPKLLRSATAEVLLTKSNGNPLPKSDDVLNYIDRSKHGASAEEQPNERTRTKLVKTDKTYRFSTEDAQFAGSEVHTAIITQ